jgi:hypothetical protein
MDIAGADNLRVRNKMPLPRNDPSSTDSVQDKIEAKLKRTFSTSHMEPHSLSLVRSDV